MRFDWPPKKETAAVDRLSLDGHGRSQGAITASCGVSDRAWEPYRDPREFDSASWWSAACWASATIPRRRPPSTSARSLPRVACWIGLGTGTFILARAGVMDGYRCCVSWYHLNDFRNEFPNLTAVADQVLSRRPRSHHVRGGIGVVDLAARLIGQHCWTIRSPQKSGMIRGRAAKLGQSAAGSSGRSDNLGHQGQAGHSAHRAEPR